MRNVLSFLLLVLLYSVALASEYSIEDEQYIKLNLLAVPDASGKDREPDDDLNNKRRLPSLFVSCIIDENGVSFQMDTTPEIIGYEIYDSESVLIYSVGDEEDFIQTLFSLSGSYTVVFRTEEYAYIGSIKL